MAQFLHLCIMIALAGSLAWPIMVGPRPPDRPPPLVERLRSSYRAMAWWFCLAALLTLILWLIETTTRLGGVSPFSPGGAATAGRLLARSQFGTIWSARCGLLLLLLAGLTIRRSKGGRFAPAVDCTLLALATGALLLLGWTGHAAASTGPLRPLHVIADLAHLAAVANWLGGLLPFGLALAAASTSDGAALLPLLQRATRRFGRLALLSVLTLTASGVIKVWLLVGSVEGLVATDYGALMLAKFGLIVPILLLAAFNRWWLTPRLMAICPQEAGTASTRATLRRFVWSVAGEIAIGAAILILAGILGVTPPPMHTP